MSIKKHIEPRVIHTSGRNIVQLMKSMSGSPTPPDDYVWNLFPDANFEWDEDDHSFVFTPEEGMRFLHLLRESGITNMWLSPDYIRTFFNVDSKIAIDMFLYWKTGFEALARITESHDTIR